MDPWQSDCGIWQSGPTKDRRRHQVGDLTGVETRLQSIRGMSRPEDLWRPSECLGRRSLGKGLDGKTQPVLCQMLMR